MTKRDEAAAARDRSALTLYQAGVQAGQIARELRFRDAAAATAAVRRELDRRGVVTDPALIRAAALDRLDRLIRVVWPKALEGDSASIDRVQALEERRLRIVAMTTETGGGDLLAAVDKAIARLDLDERDAAAVALARSVALQMDRASGVLDATAQTKAAYLSSHLLPILRELGATPAARDQIVEVVVPKETKDELDDFTRRRRVRQGGGAPLDASAP